MSGAKQTIVLCITPLQYKVCGDQQGNTTLCLGQAQPRGLIWVPRNWGHCFENGFLFLPHLRINQSNCFAVYKEKLHLPFPLLHALSTGLVRNVGSWGSFVTANTHWYTKAWAWKSSSLLLFSKDSNVCDSTRTWERRSKGLIHLPIMQLKHNCGRKVGGNGLLDKGQELDTHLPSSSCARNGRDMEKSLSLLSLLKEIKETTWSQCT